MNLECNLAVQSISPSVVSEISLIIHEKVHEIFKDHVDNVGIVPRILKFTIQQIPASIGKISKIRENKLIIETQNHLAHIKGSYCNDSLICEFHATVDVMLKGEYLLMIIKPDAYSYADQILELLKAKKLKIAQHDKHDLVIERQLTLTEAREFYKDHETRPSYEQLCSFIASNTVKIMAICGHNAIEKASALVGATNPQDASPGTIRHTYGTSIERNAIHYSDSYENAKREMNQFFPELKSILF